MSIDQNLEIEALSDEDLEAVVGGDTQTTSGRCETSAGSCQTSGGATCATSGTGTCSQVKAQT